MLTQQITLAEAIDLYLLDIQSQRFTEASQKYYKESLKRFERGIKAEKLAGITQSDIKEYLTEFAAKGLSSSYQHNQARAIKAFCNYCVSDELIEESPFRGVKMPRLEKTVKFDCVGCGEHNDVKVTGLQSFFA